MRIRDRIKECKDSLEEMSERANMYKELYETAQYSKESAKELSGKVIVFENESEAKKWFDSIRAVEEHAKLESMRIDIENMFNK